MEKDELDLKEELKELKELKRQELKKRRNREDGGSKEGKIKPNAIYLSNLEKQNTTEDQLIDEFSKFGAIKRDQAGVPKCKLYKDDEGKVKGDALIVYARHESVPIAIEMMNGYKLNGFEIKVEVAQFQDKKRKLEDSNDEERSYKSVKSHNNEENVPKPPVVVIGNILDLYEDYHEQELDDIKRDILDGCLEIGFVKKIDLNSVTGEAEVSFENESHARNCCKEMNGRFFDGRRLLVYMKGEEDESPSDDESQRDSSEGDDLLE
ncbi:hypothetical protein ZYGR_0H01290 [Zygosaccharomyces rouxii]|uniref:ZYRO0B06996p n=2 Tax=Zygosaccharomyces rouxii TaxID=4956 RepID=C5DRA9_ZYGRC|nr:uncharacterized protein ZYRO0B06996g [Zygosaccharomyces rouxii]KAH9200137.1 hypothetical protein LQ764DRAFT_113228 [Zygosaccharomyces rouxii]GAV47288.1 hypothetical protein ZYGR_0H01290 [Zygosaccharomyces rouxii]CAR26320.1 ZYRO0B06996p [Zygosaccharomyces rouxii]